uniref:CLAVATA3/ESR (CLE)-related protein 26 n=1 Tax=Noccaea caerulescens TaxID=107243 RepID=A0A1J3D190_NOCCA
MRNLRSLRLQLLLRTLFTVGLVTLLMIDGFVLQNNNETEKTKEIAIAATTNNSIIHAKEIQEQLEDGSRHGDLSYVASNRKVPRGPDPIHNRRAGNSRRPPGRA